MKLSAVIDALVASGATPQQIAAVVRASEEADASAIEKRRASDRDRQAKRRIHVMSRDVTLVTRDICDPPPPEDPQPSLATVEVNQTPTTLKVPPPNADKRRRSAGAPVYSPEFLLLWGEFPHHPNASKAEAYRSWSMLPEEDRDKCLDGALAYARYLGEQRQKRPDYPSLHLATFVNQRRWESLLEQRH